MGRLPSIKHMLGEEFWVEPAGLSEPLSLIYSNICAALKADLNARGGTIVDYMLAERIAATYIAIRQREANTEVIADVAAALRSRRDLNADWASLALNIKKLWATEKDEKASELVLQKVGKALEGVWKTMPNDQVKAVQKQLADELAAQGL